MNRGSKIEQPFTDAPSGDAARPPPRSAAGRDSARRGPAVPRTRLRRHRHARHRRGRRPVGREPVPLLRRQARTCSSTARTARSIACSPRWRRRARRARRPPSGCASSSSATCRRSSTRSKAPPRTCRSNRCRRRCATAIVKKRDRYEQALRRLIADGIRAGELVDMDPAIVARAMLGAMNWTVTWFRPEGPITAALVGDVISRFLVRGDRRAHAGGQSARCRWSATRTEDKGRRP